jgi:MtaA/CmuA family methyltransferase
MMNIVKDRVRPKAVPFICPGGIIVKAVLAEMGKPAAYWQDLYTDADKLYQLAKALYERCGLDNYGIPLCFDLEAELFGAEVDYNASFCELKIREYPFSGLKELLGYEKRDTSRRGLILEVIRRLRAQGDGVPVIGNITGPLTLLTQLITPDRVFKAMLRDADMVHQVLKKLTYAIEEYGYQQIDAGVQMLVIGEPVANGEILGPDNFALFCAPYLTELYQSVGRKLAGRLILHICGRVDNLLTELDRLPISMLSVDSQANIKKIKQHLKPKTIIASICTHRLAKEKTDQIDTLSRQLINQGADAISLPCGLNPVTPLENLRAMRKAALNDRNKKQ